MSEARFTKGPWGEKNVLVRGLNFLSHANYPTELGKANAHLIAAAPELYEALEDVLNSKEIVNDDPLVNKIIAALAKARGER